MWGTCLHLKKGFTHPPAHMHISQGLSAPDRKKIDAPTNTHPKSLPTVNNMLWLEPTYILFKLP